MDVFPGMETVLGRASVLARSAPIDRRLGRRAGVDAGVAALIPLYGPRAELAVALRDPADLSLADELVAELAWVANLRGIDTLIAPLQIGQQAIARRFSTGRKVGGALHLPTAQTMPAGWAPAAEAAGDYRPGAGVAPDDPRRRSA
ncbi:hypothetical protein NBH00_20720 [Paraconexibacter antarcticus]|uniref:Uncharacterized protein n=1 Tax=Paraconexibacter antarcticus TaxID=2949664 RepID=A0ABY5DNZ5_9ACTN|nr:hypothetical protein [Paraconexibacter antarcticus]UTI63755.1 hypothetical protein NBH00_20720 [Paraconexibacter antarcticus]